MVSAKEAEVYLHFLESGSTAGMTEAELRAVRRIEEPIQSNKIDYNGILRIRNETVKSDKQLNILLNYWYFFDEKEKEIQELLGVSLESILYSKYYWCTQYKNRYNELYGKDVGIDQQQYKIIEEMTQRINDVDWSFIQMIEEGKTN